MLLTNILTLVLLVVLLTIVPMIPGLVMTKLLSAGLADDRVARRPAQQ
ncbi:MAG: hypothetical protein ABWZ98_14455 [Nakamurella sp.]